MPRTKRILQDNTCENVKPSKSTLVRELVNSYMKALDDELAMRQINIESKADRLMLNVDALIQEHRLKYRHWGHKTMKELESITIQEPTTLTDRTKNATLNSTKGRKRGSTSLGKNKGNASALTSTMKKTRPSRSLSRTKVPAGNFILNTPVNQSITSYGMITPKVKPNTPQIVLRRPKQGEMAVSMRGSPLMINHITSEEKANVNIPLTDGRVFSIQPQRGLRASEIPDIDPDTRRQIETLRDNLSTVLNVY